jgi:hypothetical protein
LGVMQYLDMGVQKLRVRMVNFVKDAEAVVAARLTRPPVSMPKIYGASRVLTTWTWTTPSKVPWLPKGESLHCSESVPGPRTRGTGILPKVRRRHALWASESQHGGVAQVAAVLQGPLHRR